MSKFFRYVFVQSFRTTLLVVFILLMVVWLSQSLRFIEMIVNNGLSIGGFLIISSLLLPSFLGLILPVSAFIGIAIVYIKLHNDRELIVMRAGGISPLRLMSPAMAVATLITVILYSINLYFLPAGYLKFKDMQQELRNDLAGLVVREGAFNTMGNKLTVYVRQREQSGTLRGLLIHDASSPNSPVTMMAERGTLLKTPEGPRFILEQGNRQEINLQTSQLSTLYFDRYILDMNDYSNEQQDDRWRKPNERFIGELFNPDLTDIDERTNKDKFLIEGHQRLAWPLYPIPFALLAGASVIGGTFNRRGIWRRMIPISLLFTGTLLLGVSMPSITANNINMIPVLYGVPLVVTALALWTLFQAPRRKKLG